MKNKYLNLSLVFLSLAVVLFVLLTKEHIFLKVGASEGPSYCSIDSKFNCEAVAASSYAQLGGVPMALLGLLTHVFLILLILVARFEMSEKFDRFYRFALAGSFFTVITAIVMASISSLIIQSYCLFCIGTYVLSFLSMVSLIMAGKQSLFTSFRRLFSEDIPVLFSEHLWVFVCAVLIFPVAMFLNAMILDQFGYQQLKLRALEAVAQWEVQKSESFSERGLSLQKDQNPAVMTIVEFADFLCPHCKHAAPTLHAFALSRPGVRLIFKPFPLDGNCNKSIPQAGDGLRCQLAYANYCAEKLAKKGWLAHDWIFDHQREFFEGKPQLLEQLIAQFKLDPAEFKSCLESEEAFLWAQGSAAEGSMIRGTPTIFVNGRLLEMGQSLPVLQGVYEKIIKK